MVINKKYAISSVVAGFFISLFTAYLDFPVAWYGTIIDYGNLLIAIIFWSVVAYIMMNVFKKYGLPF